MKSDVFPCAITAYLEYSSGQLQITPAQASSLVTAVGLRSWDPVKRGLVLASDRLQ